MAEKMKTLGIRVTAKEAKKIEEQAAAQGKNVSEFVRDCIDLVSNFDKGFLRYVDRLAEGLKIPRYLVIQNMLLTKIAVMDADERFSGPGLLLDFQFTSGGVVTGEELYKQAYDNRVREIENQIKDSNIGFEGNIE